MNLGKQKVSKVQGVAIHDQLEGRFQNCQLNVVQLFTTIESKKNYWASRIEPHTYHSYKIIEKITIPMYVCDQRRLVTNSN